MAISWPALLFDQLASLTSKTRASVLAIVELNPMFHGITNVLYRIRSSIQGIKDVYMITNVLHGIRNSMKGITHVYMGLGIV